MHVMKMRAWDLCRIIITKLKISSLESSWNCWWINVSFTLFRGIVSLMCCFMWNSFLSENKVSFSNVFVGCFCGRIKWKLFICCIMHWDEMSGIFTHFKIMSSHSSLSLNLSLLFQLSHVSWLSLIMRFMGRVIILRMISKSKMRFSEIFLCFFIQSWFSKVIWRILIICVSSCYRRIFIITQYKLCSSHIVSVFNGLCSLSPVLEW